MQAGDRVAAVAAGVDELAGLEHYIRTTKPGREQATFLTVRCGAQIAGQCVQKCWGSVDSSQAPDCNACV